MEVHAPHQPIHSFKDFSIHLFTITIGLLIALGLEGLVDRAHWRNVVQEANDNITAEIRDNKKQVDELTKSIAAYEASHKKVLDYLDDLLAHGKSDLHGFELSHTISDLSEASWDTAQVVGALGHMDYSEVKRYDGVYQLQKHLILAQQKAIDNVINATTAFAYGDPTKLGPADLRHAKELITASLSSLHAERQIGEGLSQSYAEALNKK